MATKKAAKKGAPKKTASKPAANKPIKQVLSKSGLVEYITTTCGVMAKDVRAVLAALEGAVQCSIPPVKIEQISPGVNDRYPTE